MVKVSRNRDIGEFILEFPCASEALRDRAQVQKQAHQDTRGASHDVLEQSKMTNEMCCYEFLTSSSSVVVWSP